MADSSRSYEIPYEEIEPIVEVGQGGFGTIYKARWNKKTVAVKKIPYNLNSQSERRVENEISILCRLAPYPNIIEFYGFAKRDNVMCIVMEYVPCGSLDKYIHDEPKQKYTKGEAIDFALQCAKGMSSLHEQGLVHRDLKPANLLLVNDFKMLKICDFGLGVEIKSTMTSCLGTMQWMAPEIAAGKKYTEKCDVYSWSVILWELFSRQLPFYDKGGNIQEILLALHRGERPQPLTHLPEEIKKIVEKCWHQDPSERYSMADLVVKMTEILGQFPDANKLVECIAKESKDAQNETASATGGNSKEENTQTKGNKRESEDAQNETASAAGGNSKEEHTQTKVNTTKNQEDKQDQYLNEEGSADECLPRELIIEGYTIEKISRLTNMNMKTMKDFRAGCFGILFSAKRRNRKVVVKVYYKTDEKLMANKMKAFDPIKRNTLFIQPLDISTKNLRIMLVMEYAEGGSLHNFLHTEPKRHYNIQKAFLWLIQTINALVFLCSDGVIEHRDIRTGNILLCNNYDEIKIGDFKSEPEAKYLYSSGKTKYCFPLELTTGGKITEKTYSFCFGIIMWEVIFREEPTEDHHMDNFVHTLFAKCPSDLVDTMNSCWNKNQNNRPTLSEVRECVKSYFLRTPRLNKDKTAIDTLQEIRDGSSCFSGIQ